MTSSLSAEAISIHAPRMGSDPDCWPIQACPRYFNPRSPDGERPATWLSASHGITDFNPRSPDGERPATEINRLWPQLFQSTLPGWGATGDMGKIDTQLKRFQSTLPGWGATFAFCHGPSLRVYFNPRSPDGERLQWSFGRRLQVLFQSTLPGWGATGNRRRSVETSKFQSTLPGWGATRRRACRSRWSDFNPRSPDGERPCRC